MNLDNSEEKLLCRHPACSCPVSAQERYCSQACSRSRDISECSCSHESCCDADTDSDTLIQPAFAEILERAR